jgi:uncharacterized repeat protein (TIGR03803 family)
MESRESRVESEGGCHVANLQAQGSEGVMSKVHLVARCVRILAVGAFFASTVSGAEARRIHVLADMPPGGNPLGELVMDSFGNLYGTTLYGGDSDHRTVFSVSPRGKLNIVHSFGVDGNVPDQQTQLPPHVKARHRANRTALPFISYILPPLLGRVGVSTYDNPR